MRKEDKMISFLFKKTTRAGLRTMLVDIIDTFNENILIIDYKKIRASF